MTWKEIRSWAKGHGYTCEKKESQYNWHKDSDPSIICSSPSVSKLAKAIFNDMTDNKWVEHQNNYVEE
jgi:hypothetical protein